MQTISPEILSDIERRVAEGQFASIDELLSTALRALDDSRRGAQDWLETELLVGLEGEDVPMTRAEWDDIEREAQDVLRTGKHR